MVYGAYIGLGYINLGLVYGADAGRSLTVCSNIAAGKYRLGSLPAHSDAVGLGRVRSHSTLIHINHASSIGQQCRIHTVLAAFVIIDSARCLVHSQLGKVQFGSVCGIYDTHSLLKGFDRCV